MSVFQNYPFQMTASLLNPWGGDNINARPAAHHDRRVRTALETGT